MQRRSGADSFARAIAWIAGASFVALGIWAFLGPRSFYAHVATFPPYNRHFIHDIGAFTIGIGASLLVAVMRSDGLLVALWGAGVGSLLHGISHVEDRALGGRGTDPEAFVILGLVVLAGAIARTRARIAQGGRDVQD